MQPSDEILNSDALSSIASVVSQSEVDQAKITSQSYNKQVEVEVKMLDHIEKLLTLEKKDQVSSVLNSGFVSPVISIRKMPISTDDKLVQLIHA